MASSESFDTFKGWAIPGPKPVQESPASISGAQGEAGDSGSAPQGETGSAARSPFEAGPGESLDSLSGHFKLLQYKAGHRFSTDDILVGWYGSSWGPRADRVLDLGSGIGTVSTVCAWRLPGAKLVTIEAQDISVRLARRSVARNGLQDRVDIREFDFRDEKALAEDERFDLITGSPPYFPLGTGVLAEHPQKVACRFEVRGSVHDYCQVASRHLAPGGVFTAIFPYVQADRVRDAMREAGMTMVRARPIVFREGEEPLMWLFLGMKAEHLPESMRGKCWDEPALIIRAKDGSIHPEYRAVKLAIGFPP